MAPTQLQSELFRVAVFASLVFGVYLLTAFWTWRRWRPIPPRNGLERLFFRTATGWGLWTAAFLGALCILYGLLVEPTRLQVTTYTIQTGKFPRGAQVRIVQLADLHVRRDGPREAMLPELVRSLHPDIICHTGDLFGVAPPEDVVVRLLKSWDAPQFACEGNLDSLGDFTDVLRTGGVQLLRDQKVDLEVRGLPLTITGTGREGSISGLLKGIDDRRFNILLCHQPQGFVAARRTTLDLMLSGHTHGGQVCVPGFGALITLDRLGPKYASGMFREGSTTLVVSRGIGCEPGVPEMRFWCPPEVVVIDIIGTG